MKIYTAKQLKKADEFTLKAQQISSLELMERASVLAFSELIKDFKNKAVKFNVFCGIGNNGGDGLVIARKIIKYGYDVQVFVVNFNAQHSFEFKENLKRLKEISKQEIIFLEENSSFPVFAKKEIIIDAIFGIGLNRPMPIWVQQLVEHLNSLSSVIYAIDLPSGMFADLPAEENQPIIKAKKTITFQSPKLAFYLPKTAIYTGKIKILDIGLAPEFLNTIQEKYQLLRRKDLKLLIKKRDKFSHKGTFGHLLISGGSYGMMGSMILSTKAVLRIGAGKTTALIPKCGYEIMQVAVPEAMTLTSAEEKYLYDFEKPNFIPEVICFGMGATTHQKTEKFFVDLLNFADKPMLIDADGLNLLANNKELLNLIPVDSVLTPHPKELKGLIGNWKNEIEKIEKTQALAKKHNIIILIKGAHTLIVTAEKVFINNTGNPGMATAGSGDVLSGIIAGLMAQNYSSKEAAILGVWLHGKAGDLAVKKQAEESLIAGDLIDFLGKAIRKLK